MTPSDEEGRSYPLYFPKYPRSWWLRKGPYRRFAAREITSMFSAAVSATLLAFLFELSRGPKAYEGFLRLLDSPWMVAASALTLTALLYHTATWFRLTTHIVVIRVRGWTLPPALLIVALSVAWVGASAAVAYFLVWF
jgi:fumarate reductase subunit C